MMALTMGTLIVGIGRLFIDSHWGIEAFGQVSFALLLTKLFLVFVNQISFVIFPILRRVEESERRAFYLKAHHLLTLILPLTLFAYLPLQVFIRMWLPAYEESLTFIGLLLPLCLFEGKMKMLSSTYFKLLRKEKSLLKINVLCACLSLILSLIGTYVFNRITIVVTFMTVALVIRSVLSEVYVSKQLNVSVYKQAFSEISLALVFVASTSFLATTQGMIVFLMAYVVYVILSKRVILRRVLQP
jgi:O-antigen/teichoic acid export membrane protein